MKVPSALESPSAITVIPGQNPNLITRIPVQLGEGGEVTQVYYTLDGSTSYISSDFDSSAIGTGDITISCWLRVPAVPSGTKYVWILGNDNLDDSLALRIRSTKLEVFGRLGTEDEIEVTAANTIVPDLWTHVVVTRTGTTIELFVNGTSNASGTNIEAAASLSDGETWIGYHIGSSSFAGDFANFEIRNAVITDSEIYNNFNAGTAYTTGTEQTQTLTPTNATTTDLSLPGDWSNIWGFYFDGVNDHIQVPDSDNLSLIDGSNDAACSFEVWIYPQSTTNFIICSKTQNSSNREFMFRLSTGRVQFVLYDGGASDYLQLLQTASLAVDTWHHIIVTYDGSEVHTGLALYIDGASEAATTSLSGTYNGQNNTTGPLEIGRWTIGGHATGLIDEFIIHSKELSSAEVATRYNAGTPSDPRSLNPLYYLHEGTGADWSGNNHLATLKSGAEITTNVPGVIPFFNTYSVTFDGVDDYATTGFIIPASSTLSVSSWVKTSNHSFASVQDYGSGGLDREARLGWFINSSSKFIINIGNGVTSWVDNSVDASGVLNGDWHHIVLTGNGTDINLYVDGSLVKNYTTTVAVGTVGERGVTIGRLGSFGGLYLDGLLDEIAYFNTELSAAQVTAIYNSGVPADLTSYSPIAWWRMGDNDGGTGTTITDQGSGGNDATLTNGPTFSTDVPT